MVTIKPGTLRDLCFVASNMREHDRREIGASATLDTMTMAGALSWHTAGPDWCWTAWLDDQPQAAFGVSELPLQPHMRSAWAWGTNRFRRCVPAITRFCVEEWPRRLIPLGVKRVEVRSIEGHDIAHKWLTGLKARREAEMKSYGVNGETFTLWAWLAEDFADVLPDPENPALALDPGQERRGSASAPDE